MLDCMAIINYSNDHSHYYGKVEFGHANWQALYLCICVSVCQQKCFPLASVESVGDIAIFFSEQLVIEALRR